MRRFGWLVLTMLFALPAFAEDLVVANVMRNIPLSDEDPIYKDFYLNGGESAGLKKNLVVNVFRKITVRDASGSQAYGDIEVPVAQLRVLAVYGRVTVAREYKLLSRDENPMLEQTGILVGDRIDLKGAFVDSKGWATPKRKVSEVESTPERSTASVSAAPASTAAAAPSTAPVAPTGPAANVKAVEEKKVAQASGGMPSEFIKPGTEGSASTTRK